MNDLNEFEKQISDGKLKDAIRESVSKIAAMRGSKSISEVSGNGKPSPTTYKDTNKIVIPLSVNPNIDHQQALIELSYINAAIALAQGSNDIGCEIHIGPITIGVSVNDRVVPILQAEADEIRKYLRGETNNYE